MSSVSLLSEWPSYIFWCALLALRLMDKVPPKSDTCLWRRVRPPDEKFNLWTMMAACEEDTRHASSTHQKRTHIRHFENVMTAYGRACTFLIGIFILPVEMGQLTSRRLMIVNLKKDDWLINDIDWWETELQNEWACSWANEKMIRISAASKIMFAACKFTQPWLNYKRLWF